MIAGIRGAALRFGVWIKTLRSALRSADRNASFCGTWTQLWFTADPISLHSGNLSVHLRPQFFRFSIAIGTGSCAGSGIMVTISFPASHSGAFPLVFFCKVVSTVEVKLADNIFMRLAYSDAV